MKISISSHKIVPYIPATALEWIVGSLFPSSRFIIKNFCLEFTFNDVTVVTSGNKW